MPEEKTFVIPKKNRSSSVQLNVKVEKGSREWDNINSILKHNCRLPRNSERFALENMWMINNDRMNASFAKKRQEMKDDGRQATELRETYGFSLCKDFRIAMNICRFGLKTGHLFNGNHLGDCKMGVYVNRFADTLKKYHDWLNQDYTGFIVVLKLIRGRVKNVQVHKETDSILEPDPNFDCHTSKFTPSQFQTMRHAEAFFAGRYYLYEFDHNLELVNIPRQVSIFVINCIF